MAAKSRLNARSDEVVTTSSTKIMRLKDNQSEIVRSETISLEGKSVIRPGRRPIRDRVSRMAPYIEGDSGSHRARPGMTGAALARLE
jgi:hypothetical protein